jgi:hypothetical protein
MMAWRLAFIISLTLGFLSVKIIFFTMFKKKKRL